MDRPAVPEVPAPAPGGQGRLLSLDALRGFDMFWIAGGESILIALAKGLQSEWFNRHVIPQTRHVPWEGFVAWDLIMPLFLFMVGVAMPFSLARRLEKGDSKARIYCHVLIRVAVLWVLGMIAQGRLLEYDVSRLRFYSNTLQAIAAGYLISTIILLHLRTWAQAAVTVGLLLAYWGLLMWVPVPGHGTGPLTEQGNLAIYLDKLILGTYQDGTPYTWILSSMTFAATVMMGAFAGQLLRSGKGDWTKVLILAGAGLACILAGWGWGQVFPIIKHIWTSSMVLFAGGWSLLLLAVFYLLIDVLGLRRLGLTFAVIGANAIFTYMAVHLFDFKSLSDPFVGGLARWTGPWQDLVRTVAGVVVMWLILLFMYRRRIFIKI